MLPAEKTHYRKGLALGLTMAETFSIIVFILLLVCAELLRDANDAKEVAEDNLKEERVDHAFTRHTLESMAPSNINTDAWLRESRRLREELDHVRDSIKALEADSIRRSAEIEKFQQMLASNDRPDQLENELAQQAGHIEILKDSLSQASDAVQELERQRESLNEELNEAQQIGETVRKAIASRQGMDPTEANYADEADETLREPAHADAWADSLADDMLKKAARTDRLADSLEVARDIILSLETGQAMWDSLANASSTAPGALRATAAQERMRASSMQDRLAARERERDEAIDRAEFREAQVEQLLGGRGIDPPPCWLDAENNPEYIFRAVLTDSGIRLCSRSRRLIVATIRRCHICRTIEDGRTYAPREFLELSPGRFMQCGSGSDNFFWRPKGCRYWVRPVDETTGDRKDVFPRTCRGTIETFMVQRQLVRRPTPTPPEPHRAEPRSDSLKDTLSFTHEREALSEVVLIRISLTQWGYSSVGRALQSHCRGQRFDSA